MQLEFVTVQAVRVEKSSGFDFIEIYGRYNDSTDGASGAGIGKGKNNDEGSCGEINFSLKSLRTERKMKSGVK